MSADRSSTPTTGHPSGRAAAVAHGVSLIEASAGTGKTHAITSAVVHSVASGEVAIDRILVVTFTRAAAAELRGRIRHRLGSAQRLLAGSVEKAHRTSSPVESLLDSATAIDDDTVAELLRGASSIGDVDAMIQALTDAVRRFDDATIDTIHGFCARLLGQAGFELGVELGSEIVDDVTTLIDEVTVDVLIRHTRSMPPLMVRWLDSVDQLRDLSALRRLVDKVEAVPGLAFAPSFDEAVETAWSDSVARFAARWHGSKEQLETWLAGHRDGPALRPRQRTYRPEPGALHMAAIERWLAVALLDSSSPQAAAGGDSGQVAADFDDALGYFGREKLADFLEEPERFDEIDALVAIDELATQRLRHATMWRAQFVTEARSELDARKRQAGEVSFADLLRLVAAALADPSRRDAVRAAVAARFDMALIDEFQDTDSLQWTIFSTLFAEERLLLVGDPKQSIYRFRHADLGTYLAATATIAPSARRRLAVNYRSDQRYLDGVTQLFTGARFGPAGPFAEPAIPFLPVHAPSRAVSQRLRFADESPLGATGDAPFVVRFVDPTIVGVTITDDDAPVARSRLEQPIAGLVADDISALLTSGGQRFVGRATGDDGTWRALTAGDIAVLVMTHRQADLVQRALSRVGVASVVSSDRDVFDSDEADRLGRLLRAIATPGDDRSVRAAMAASFFAADAARLDADEAWYEQTVDSLATARRRWNEQGVAVALQQLMGAAGMFAFIAQTPFGLRALTNVRHLIELLHTEESRRGLGAIALLSWFDQQRSRAQAGNGRPNDSSAWQRLETDDDAVQITTVFGAKGLQYPVVFTPYMWRAATSSTNDIVYPDPVSGQETLDLALSDAADPAHSTNVAMDAFQRWQESIRLLYVAVTRAQHLGVCYLARATGVERSALARTIFGVDVQPWPPAVARSDGLDVEPDVSAWANRQFVDGSAQLGDAIAVCTGPPPVVEQPGPAHRPSTAQPALGARTFTRTLDTTWRRTSFSGLSADPVDNIVVAADDGGPARLSPDADAGVRWHTDDDQPGAVVDQPAGLADTAHGLLSPTGERHSAPIRARQPVLLDPDLPRGAEFGTLVHHVLEDVDFTAWRDHDTHDGLDAVVGRHLARSAVPPATLTRQRMHDLLTEGLGAAMTTPWGTPDPHGCLQQTSLEELARADRRDELWFELPLAGGYQSRGSAVSLEAIAAVFAAHAAHDEAPLAAAARRLRGRTTTPVTGFLVGSIDLLARIGGRFVVVDYKTNWLGRHQGGVPECTIDDYHPDRLAIDMVEHDYLLQYHLYVVAVDRFLRGRLAAYDYAEHFAGVRYLYVRGMTGPDTPTTDDGRTYGVFADTPSAALVADLDDVLAGVDRKGPV